MIPEFDLHEDNPTVAISVLRLENTLKMTRGKYPIIKIIHGYGSSGKGGAIRTAIRQKLEEYVYLGKIKTFIPGEAFTAMMGYADLIFKYKNELKGDRDYHHGNDGITFVMFR